MRALLSIKPEHAENIFNGTKKYEFRRKIFGQKNVTAVVVYATKPVGLIIGEFEVIEILADSPQQIWDITRDRAGITKPYFDAYFHGREKAFAIRIGATDLYQEPLDPNVLMPRFTPPQSYMYIRSDLEGGRRMLQSDLFELP
ncbi:putative transcriptional regulator [Methylobacterium sp. RAS18]|nr:putative transcriptional regulator [Methylobacterium sp. RAS18]